MLRERESGALRLAAARNKLAFGALRSEASASTPSSPLETPRLAFEMDHIMTFTTIRALTGLLLGIARLTGLWEVWPAGVSKRAPWQVLNGSKRHQHDPRVR